jgi:hypothetical protein
LLPRPTTVISERYFVLRVSVTLTGLGVTGLSVCPKQVADIVRIENIIKDLIWLFV